MRRHTRASSEGEPGGTRHVEDLPKPVRIRAVAIRTGKMQEFGGAAVTDMGGNAANGQAGEMAASRSGQSVEHIPGEISGQKPGMSPTDIKDPNYFHKVVDCQWACPAHTPVPEYIRLIAAGRYSDAYMVNWKSNVFPGILGRTCDRPCEPACRRGRVEKEPVAICRLKRVAADNKGDVSGFLETLQTQKNGKRVALIGAGPASLTVARDLLPLGYHCVMFDGDAKGGGMIRSQIPRFRLPESVTDEEVDQILDLGIETRFGAYISSLKAVLAEGWDAIFVGSG